MNFVIEQLQKNKGIYNELFKGEKEDLFLWKQTPDKWCLLEILCHLYDEEREDFKFRTKWVLERPNETPPPIAPNDWVTERNYIQQNYDVMLEKFLNERDESINWLKSLKSPKWDNYYTHPKIGDLSAKHFFDNWLAHDYLHIRQIVKLKFDYLDHHSGERLDYAGTW